MSSHDPDILVRKFIEGELSDEETRQALHRIADDAEARSTLQFELEMRGDLAATRSPQPAPSFADRTMEAVEKEVVEQTSPQSRLSSWWQALTAPIVTVPLRPAYTLAVLLLIGMLGWITWPTVPPEGATISSDGPTASSTMQQASTSSGSQQETVWTRFIYTTDDAESVAVAGDFSQWDPIPLSPRTVNGETVWTGLIPIPRGEHEYQFVIDGNRWVADPLAPVKRDDGFGAQNAVLKL